MLSKEIAQQLHDKSTRGELLSIEEVKQLEEWYAREDRSEGQSLRLKVTEKSSSALQSQIDNALAQLMTATNRIQQVAMENEVLRREVLDLRLQVSRVLSQPA